MKKENKKVYVVSWFFPPVNAAEGIVAFKLMKESKYSYDVFTQANNDKYAFKKDDKLVSKNVNPIFSNKLDKKEWINDAVDNYFNNKEKYFCIITRCMPPESFEVGLKIKKRDKNVFWIASFSDPLAYSPYTKLIEEKNPYKNTKFTVTKPIKNGIWNLRRLHYRLCDDPEKKNKRIQKKTLMNADLIVFNNTYQMKYILSRYKKYNFEKKSVIVPHSFDESFYEKVNKFYKDKKVMSFLGHLDNYRNAKVFLEAANRIKKEDKKLKDKIEFRFYGNIGEKDKVYIDKNNMSDIIKICKPVTYLESLKVMKQSDYLLLIDANLDEYLKENIFFASKIVDYLGSGSNIFAITMDKGISKDVILKSGGVVSNFETEEVYNNLKNIINDKTKYKLNDNYIKLFNNKEVSKNFDIFLEKVYNGIEVECNTQEEDNNG